MTSIIVHSGDDYSPYPSNPVSRGRSPAPNTCSVREHVRELSRGRSPSNVDLYSSRESLRTREKSPLARKLEKEGKVKFLTRKVFYLSRTSQSGIGTFKSPSSRRTIKHVGVRSLITKISLIKYKLIIYTLTCNNDA